MRPKTAFVGGIADFKFHKRSHTRPEPAGDRHRGTRTVDDRGFAIEKRAELSYAA
jgi:hypothetical protein